MFLYLSWRLNRNSVYLVFFSELSALDSNILLFLIISLEIFWTLFDSNLLLKHYKSLLLAKRPISDAIHCLHFHILGLHSLKLFCDIIFCWNIWGAFLSWRSLFCFLWFSVENMMPETTPGIIAHCVLCPSAPVFQHEKSLSLLCCFTKVFNWLKTNKTLISILPAQSPKCLGCEHHHPLLNLEYY